MKFVAGPSPLSYGVPGVRRVTMVDATVPPPAPNEVYFAKGATDRKGKVPEALPGAAAFIDYSVLSDGSVYIHYVTTRRDLRKQGYGALLLEHFLRSVEKDGVPSVDFGRILSDPMEKLFLRWRRLSDDGKYRPRVYGKL
jgi:GNAT superfamily N-acetyltransferase